ncbi:hypothetical protein [Herbaspirillum sp. YR522]|uniref:hypothetical protein n=1 Tax=Herbaspirillum sp. YR522 TaxID=1144342 RepID=UPI00026FCDB7|nr:hypothetical protein [Herbaspirillum sp. YR522]EJM97558.1 hypothetical protein PMI40_04319 [Herbaspirillum sp. YR522]
MSKDLLPQRANDTSLDVDLPGLEADRVIQDSDEEIEALAALPEEQDAIAGNEAGSSPSELREEDIGLAHVAGVDDAEVGRELNINGDEDNDEDDRGNPTGLTQIGRL